MNNLLGIVSSLSSEGMDFSERAMYSLKMTLLGMVAIFSVLAILWGIVEIFRRLLANGNDKREVASKSENTVETVIPTPASAPVADDYGAVVAAITAAIASMRENDESIPQESKGFRVVSFKRANGFTAWNSKH